MKHVPNSGDPAKVYSCISEIPTAAIQIPTDTTSTTCYAIVPVGYDPGPPKSGGPADFGTKFPNAVTTTPREVIIYLYYCTLYQARVTAFNYILSIAAQKLCGAINFWANICNHGHHDTYDTIYNTLYCV